MFILTILTFPFAFLTAFSSIGVNWRLGPPQGAQKSIRTGCRFDSSMTSFTNVWVVVSLIRSGAGCGAAPLPWSIIVTGSSSDSWGWAAFSTAANSVHLSGGLSGKIQLVPGTSRNVVFAWGSRLVEHGRP